MKMSGSHGGIVSNWNTQASYLRDDSSCSWVSVHAMGPNSGLEQ